MKALFDTNILIDYLRRVPNAQSELEKYSENYISSITWIEVMAGIRGTQEDSIARNFLKRFTLISLNGPIAERSANIRRQSKIRLPDAIIWASAQEHNLLLVTRNTKDFPVEEPGIRVPYQV